MPILYVLNGYDVDGQIIAISLNYPQFKSANYQITKKNLTYKINSK